MVSRNLLVVSWFSPGSLLVVRPGGPGGRGRPGRRGALSLFGDLSWHNKILARLPTKVVGFMLQICMCLVIGSSLKAHARGTCQCKLIDCSGHLSSTPYPDPKL